jgi:hypothetical protein
VCIVFGEAGDERGPDVVVGVGPQWKAQRRGSGIDQADHRVCDLPRVVGHVEGAVGDRAPHPARRGAVVFRHARRGVEGAAESGRRRAWFDDGQVYAERGDFPGRRLAEALDSPLRRVVVAEVRVGGLAAGGRDLQDASVSLGAQVRECGPDDVDRAEEVGVDDPPDLLVGGLLYGGEDAVAGIVHDHVNLAELCEGVVHDSVHLPGVGDVEPGDPQLVAVPGAQVIQRLGPAQGRGDAIAAGQQAFGEQAAEAGESPGNEPGDWHDVPFRRCCSLSCAAPDGLTTHTLACKGSGDLAGMTGPGSAL